MRNISIVKVSAMRAGAEGNVRVPLKVDWHSPEFIVAVPVVFAK